MPLTACSALRATAIFCATAALALPAAAQEKTAQESAKQAINEDSTWVEIAGWDTNRIYDGWSARELLYEEAYGPGSNQVGEVEDMIIGPDGRIQKVVVEGGGFLDIGDSHVAIPWEEVDLVGATAISVPVTEDNLDNYGIFEHVDSVPPRPSNFRLREMIGDYVTANGVGYGTIKDVIFDQDGKIEAVIVWPAAGYGYPGHPTAVPYSTAYDPYGAYYETPYTIATLEELRPFDYSRFR